VLAARCASCRCSPIDRTSLADTARSLGGRQLLD
jgi:hypothetical protein